MAMFMVKSFHMEINGQVMDPSLNTNATHVSLVMWNVPLTFRGDKYKPCMYQQKLPKKG